MSGSLNTPFIGGKICNTDGTLTAQGQQFLMSLWNRTGGAVGISVATVQDEAEAAQTAAAAAEKTASTALTDAEAAQTTANTAQSDAAAAQKAADTAETDAQTAQSTADEAEIDAMTAIMMVARISRLEQALSRTTALAEMLALRLIAVDARSLKALENANASAILSITARRA